MDPKERRKHKRRKILDTFSLFVAIPLKGNLKLNVKDVSEEGLSFESQFSDQEEFAIRQDESFEIHFYLNQTLFLSLNVKAVRVSQPQFEDSRVLTGVQLLKKESKNHQAYLSFIQMIDYLTVST